MLQIATIEFILDIKDTRSASKVHKLHQVIENAKGKYDFRTSIVDWIQNVRSHEIEQIQLADLLCGILAYANHGHTSSEAKLALVKRMQDRSGYHLDRTTLYKENKVNIFRWQAQEVITMPTPLLSWLPEILNLDGEWTITLRRLYELFSNDFITTKRFLDNHEVIWDTRKIDSGYDEGFWHLISKTDQHIGDRVPEFRRAERLPWCGPCITNCKDATIKMWDYQEGSGKTRTYLWLENWDYVIVLEKRNIRKQDKAMLITAFFVEGDSTRRNLQRKFIKKK